MIAPQTKHRFSCPLQAQAILPPGSNRSTRLSHVVGRQRYPRSRFWPIRVTSGPEHLIEDVLSLREHRAFGSRCGGEWIPESSHLAHNTGADQAGTRDKLRGTFGC